MSPTTLTFRRYVACLGCAGHNPAVTRTPPTALANVAWANPMSGDICHDCCLCGSPGIDKGVYFWRHESLELADQKCKNHPHPMRVVALTGKTADLLKVGQAD